jgi:hypothetical protein
MEKPKKLRRLTLKQRGFVKRFIETKNGTRAALDNYDTTDRNTAAMIASDNLTKPNVRQEVEQQLKEAGLNQAYLDDSLKKVADAGIRNLAATKPETLLKAIITANKLLDRFPAEKHLEAKIDLNKVYNLKTTQSIESELVAIQKQNKHLLLEIKRNKKSN